MKTREQVLFWLTNHGCLDQFLENIRNTHTFDECLTYRKNMIDRAFRWSLTQQGDEYWRNLHDEFFNWYDSDENEGETPNLGDLRIDVPNTDSFYDWTSFGGPVRSVRDTLESMSHGSITYSDIYDELKKFEKKEAKEIKSIFKKGDKVKISTIESAFVESNEDMNELIDKTVSIVNIIPYCYEFDTKKKSLDGCFYYIKEDECTNVYTSEMFKKTK